jgi:hypothetical protein
MLADQQIHPLIQLQRLFRTHKGFANPNPYPDKKRNGYGFRSDQGHSVGEDKGSLIITTFQLAI